MIRPLRLSRAEQSLFMKENKDTKTSLIKNNKDNKEEMIPERGDLPDAPSPLHDEEFDDFDLSEDDIPEYPQEDESSDWDFEELHPEDSEGSEPNAARYPYPEDSDDDSYAIPEDTDGGRYADPEEHEDPGDYEDLLHRSAASASKKRRAKRSVIVTLEIAAAVIAAIYLAGCAYFAGHFGPRTSLNGRDISMQSPSKAAQELESEAASYTLTITGRNNVTDTISGSDISYSLSYNVSLDALVKEASPFAWPLHLFQKTAYTSEYTVSYDEAALKSAIEQSAFFQSSNITQPANSTCSYVDGSYQVVSGDPGTVPDEDGITQTITAALSEGQTELTLGDDCYQAADNEELTQTAELLNTILDLTVTMTFGDETQTLTREQLASFISAPEITVSEGSTNAGDSDAEGSSDDASAASSAGSSGESADAADSAADSSSETDSMTEEERLQAQKVLNLSRISFQEDALSEYVSTLAEKYDTKSETREFKTHSGDTITVTGGSYGWEMDQSGTVTALKDFLAGAQSGEFQPVWTQEAASHGDTDIGTTYAEVDLDEQHVYVYVDGKCVMDTDCVSGKAIDSDRYTPTGTYSIVYRKSPATLKGDGYESPVTYWMPFNRGIGFHDATWRSKFGKEIYLTSGSYGCINLPLSAAKELYSYVYSGMPVIVYGGMTPEEAQEYTGQEADPPVTVKESETDIGGGADDADTTSDDSADTSSDQAAAAAAQATQDAQNAIIQQAIQNYINQGMSSEQAQAQVQADLAAQLAAQQAAAAQ